MASKFDLSPLVALAAVHSKAKVLYSLFVRVLCLVLVLLCSTFNVFSSFAIISLGKRELVALLCLQGVMYLLVFCDSSSWCLGLVCSVIVAFSGHTLFDDSINEPVHDILVHKLQGCSHQSLCCSQTKHIEDYEDSEQNLEL